jgi:exonuclease III
VEEYDHNPLKSSQKENEKLIQRSINQLHILTYNVRTLMSYDRIIELEKTLTNIKYDIIGISEVRRLGNTIEEYENFILCSTGQTQGRHGVGFIIQKYLKQYIESYLGISERVALLNLDMTGKKFTIIQVYAPTKESDEEEVDNFYDTIYEAMSRAYEDFILMGDFNAKIGIPQKEEYPVMKQHGYGTRNVRGQRLINFAMENKLAIINTFYKKKRKRRWTWQSPNGQYKNEIDFILSNRPHLFQNIETLSINFSSDHRPLRAKILLTKPMKSR